MNSILVIRPGAIGDALLTFPVLKALREQYDGMRITLVSNAQVLPLAQAFGVAEQALYLQTVTPSSKDITKRFVAIHPGSGAVEKCWPISRFAEVIKRLWELNYPVLLLAGPADSGRVDDVLKLLSLPPKPEMFKMLTHAPLLEVAQRLLQCRGYLGNDSGITHLAAMLGVPTVAIFGATDPVIWRPVGPFVKV